MLTLQAKILRSIHEHIHMKCTITGKDIKPLHVVLINNLVDPNENQVNTLANLAAYPFVKGTNASLIMHFGLVVNYTIIFSIEPGNSIQHSTALTVSLNKEKFYITMTFFRRYHHFSSFRHG